MEVGVVGKPNVGKSTLFNALTLLDSPMAPYPFTTIAAHRGVGAVRVPCPHVERGVACTPGNAACVDGTRWVPVRLIDVPGLVPGAHAGKGLGHQFLDELRAADGFLQVVDASGATGPEGQLVGPGAQDPAEEVGWLEEELIEWVREILQRDFARATKGIELEGGKIEEILAARLTGLSIAPPAVAAALRLVPLDRARPSTWTTEELRRLARELLRAAKPRLVAANKCDRTTRDSVAALAGRVEPTPVVPTSAEAELTLRRAARAGLVRYRPGDPSFETPDRDRLSGNQVRALDEIRGILATWGSTGVQPALERLVFERLHRIAIFPVEDEGSWTDSKGRVLPDAFLVPEGTHARELAYRVHTDLGENFIRAIDGRTHRAMAADHPLAAGSVVRIVARK
jgi:ribosome-binding ATPase